MQVNYGSAGRLTFPLSFRSRGGVTYAKGQPSQVQVYATVSVTYAIQ